MQIVGGAREGRALNKQQVNGGRLYAADLVTIGSVGHSEFGASGTT